MKEEVLGALQDWRVRQSTYASLVGQLQVMEKNQFFYGDGYKKQKENLIGLIGIYISSIENMSGNEKLMGADFGTLCEEQVAEQMISYLISIGAMEDTSFAGEFKGESIHKLAQSFCMTEAQLNKILGK